MYPEEMLVKVVMDERLREAAARHLATQALRGAEGDPLPSAPPPFLVRLFERYWSAIRPRPETTTTGCMEGGKR